jgi:predicted PurR-regulated permease PerM
MAFTVLVIVVYVIVVQVQANLMAPFITGQAVQMSPATILIGLLVGFQVGGLVGSLLVVPVLASIKEAGKYVLAKLLDRDPFPDRSAAIDA